MFYLNTVTNIWWNKIRRVIQSESAINFVCVCLCGIHCQNRDNYKMGDIMHAFMVLFCFFLCCFVILSLVQNEKLNHIPRAIAPLPLSFSIIFFLLRSLARENGVQVTTIRVKFVVINMESMIWKSVFRPPFEMNHWIQFINTNKFWFCFGCN